MTSHLIDARELAAALRVKLPTIRAWAQSGEMPVIRMSRLIRFDLDEVLAWARSGGPGRAAAKRAQAANRGNDPRGAGGPRQHRAPAHDHAAK